MNHFAYCADNLEVLKLIDSEFEVVTVVGDPEEGFSSGFDVAIYDSRDMQSISKAIESVEGEYREQTDNGTTI